MHLCGRASYVHASPPVFPPHMHPHLPMGDSAPEQSLHPYSPSTTDFTDDALECIRQVIRAASDARGPDGLAAEIRAAATICARDAREAGVRAEQFVVALKRAWSTAADSSGVARQDAMEIATRLVSAAIVDFYRGE
jgi:hypothetical protein